MRQMKVEVSSVAKGVRQGSKGRGKEKADTRDRVDG
jgi:hypothetical protein